MTDVVTPWWQAVDEAVQGLVTTLTQSAARAASRGRKQSRRGPRPKRSTKSNRRHLADVIRAHRLAPGRGVDRNMIAALFTGHRALVSDPELVAAVARACDLVAGRKSSQKELNRLRAASRRIAKLIARAEAADRENDLAAAPPPALAPLIPAQPVPAAPPAVVVVPPRKRARKQRRRFRIAVAILFAALVLLALLVAWLAA